MVVTIVDEKFTEALGELEVEYNGEIYHIVYYVDNKDEYHFFYEDGKKPENYPDFENEIIRRL